MILARRTWPKSLLKFPEVKGISLFKCRSHRSIDNIVAHAHTPDMNMKNVGWICISDPLALRVNLILLHEVAHLLVGHGIHNKTWREKVLAIGGSLDAIVSCGFFIEDYHRIPQRTHDQKTTTNTTLAEG